jgi:signal transduction histidine kinase
VDENPPTVPAAPPDRTRGGRARPPRLSLRSLVYGLVLGLLGILAFTTTWGMTARIYVADAQRELRDTVLPASQDVSELTAAYSDQQRGVRGYFLTGNPDLLEPWQEGQARASALEHELEHLLASDETSAALVADVARSGEQWRNVHVRPALAEQRASGNIDAIPPEDLRAGTAAFEQVRSELDELSTRMETRTNDRFDDIATAQRAANIAVGSAVAVALATAGAAVLLVRRRLVGPLDRLLRAVDEAARPPHHGPVTAQGTTELWSIAAGVESLRLGMHASARELDAARRELTLRQERERLAADLHDLVIQRVYALGLSLGIVARRHPELCDQLEPLIREADLVTGELREVIFDLRHGPMTADILGERARDLTDDASRLLGFAPDLHVSGSREATIGQDVAHEALAVLREALSNVVKHSGASAVEVSVGVEGEDLVLRVADDGGRGADATVPSADGHGLRNMRARAVRLGGRMDIEHPAQGTTVTWRVPVRGRHGDDAPDRADPVG